MTVRGQEPPRITAENVKGELLQIDLLLVDDLHNIGALPRLQSGLADSLAGVLRKRGSTIVATSRLPLIEVPYLPSSVRCHFHDAEVVTVKQPDLAALIEILRRLARLQSIALSLDLLSEVVARARTTHDLQPLLEFAAFANWAAAGADEHALASLKRAAARRGTRSSISPEEVRNAAGHGAARHNPEHRYREQSEMPLGEVPSFHPPRQTFESLVAHAGNSVALEAAKQRAERVGFGARPLLLLGSEGVGKTHLLRAIEYCVRWKTQSCTAAYVRVPAARVVTRSAHLSPGASRM